MSYLFCKQINIIIWTNYMTYINGHFNIFVSWLQWTAMNCQDTEWMWGALLVIQLPSCCNDTWILANGECAENISSNQVEGDVAVACRVTLCCLDLSNHCSPAGVLYTIKADRQAMLEHGLVIGVQYRDGQGQRGLPDCVPVVSGYNHQLVHGLTLIVQHLPGGYPACTGVDLEAV